MGQLTKIDKVQFQKNIKRLLKKMKVRKILIQQTKSAAPKKLPHPPLATLLHLWTNLKQTNENEDNDN